MLSLEEAVNYVVTNNGLFIMPISDFDLNWRNLSVIFKNTLKQFQEYRPLRKHAVMSLSPYGVVIEDALQVRSVSLWGGNMIPSQTTTLNSIDYDFIKQDRLLMCVGSGGNFLVKYLAELPLEKLPVSQVLTTIFEGQEEGAYTLEINPEPATIEISKDGKTMKVTGMTTQTIDNVATIIYSLSGALGTGTLNSKSLELVLEYDDTSEGEVSITYTSLYDGVTKGLTVGDDFFMMWFTGNILSSLGAIKSITKMDSLPADISADDLLNYGKQLLERVETYKVDKSAFYAYLA